MKYSEKWGDSVEGAINLALSDLNLNRDQVEVIVLEEPSKGFFGIGSKLAKVRVQEVEAKKEENKTQEKKEFKKQEEKEEKEYKEEVKKEYKPEIIKEGKQEIVIEVCGLDEPEALKKPLFKNRRDSRRSGERTYKDNLKASGESKSVNERPTDLEECNDHVGGLFIYEVIKEMGLDVSVKTFSNKESVYIDIDGTDSGTIIGKRGQTLDALQYLTSLVVNKNKEGYIRVVIDAEGYRRKREATLESLANRLADKAVKSRRNVRLEPMNPYERKVIHTALQSRAEVITKSEGEEPYRRVIIEPSK